MVRVMTSIKLGGLKGHLTQGRRNKHADFWWGNLKENVHLENHGVDVSIILKWI